MWPAGIVRRLFPQLPERFTAEPRVHLGTFYGIDVCAFNKDAPGQLRPTFDDGSGGTATAIWAPPRPTLLVEADGIDEYAYEVLVFDENRARELVVAVELVSPANKDRPASRRAFITKCAALMQRGICVSIVDLVTTPHFNLYTELLAALEFSDPGFAAEPSIYAVTCRLRQRERTTRLEAWAYPLALGQPRQRCRCG